jgi:hypothetical protein
VTEELIGLASETTESLGAIEGRWFRGVAHLASGDRRAFDADLAALSYDAERMNSQVERSMVSMWEAMLAVLDGQLDTADGLVAQFLTEAGDDPNFLLGWFAQICVLRSEQGRASEMIPLGEQVLAEHGDLAAVRAMVAYLLTGVGDLEGARHTIDPLVATGFELVPDDWLLPATLGLLTPVVVIRDEDTSRHRAACVALHERLAPYHDQALVMGFGTIVTGAADRHLGTLAGALGDRAAAAGHFRSAAAVEQRLGSPLLAQHTALDQAGYLLDGDDPSERASGLALIDGVKKVAAARGWIGVVRRSDHLRRRS